MIGQIPYVLYQKKTLYFSAAKASRHGGKLLYIKTLIKKERISFLEKKKYPQVCVNILCSTQKSNPTKICLNST